MTPAFDQSARVFVAGHTGLVGSAIVRKLRGDGFGDLLLPTRGELDLRQQEPVKTWFQKERPTFVIMAAGTVGGIHANATRQAEFLYDNLTIHSNVIHSAYLSGVKRLLYLGSSCIYPKEAPQPISEDSLLTGPLEPTNASYAIAKISGIRMCEAYREQYGCDFLSAMPTNLYGPGDNFEPNNSHVLPALLHRFHCAKVEGHVEVRVWGTGEARREFLHVDDLADACIFLMRHYSGEKTINIGTGEDLRIRELAQIIRNTVAPGVDIAFDPSKPDGTPRKLLDVARIHALGWHHTISLREGIEATYDWYCKQQTLRGVPARG